MSNKKILSIISLNWCRLEYTQKSIECLIKKTTVPHRLILIDNNSDPRTGVRDYLSGITKANTNAEEVIHVFNPKNMGVAGGRNTGIYEVEKRGLQQDYIFNLDDDVLVPDNYDKQLVEACDKIPKLGITGINVEPVKYPVVEINGVRVRPKKHNLGGAALCLPRRVFQLIGYYGCGRGNLYGMEDSMANYRLNFLGLMSAYIESRGVHMDTDQRKAYRKAKNAAHKEKVSIQLKELSKAIAEMRKTGIVYNPYIPPEDYHPVDEDIFTNELIMKG